MALPRKKSSQIESLSIIANVLLAAFVICTLYFARDLLVPFALAALLTFMLAPLVTRLQRRLGRVGAVLLVVLMIFAAAGATGWVLTRQAVDLANRLPDYKENIRTKLQTFQVPSGGSLSKVSKAVEDLKKELPGGKPAEPGAKSHESGGHATKPTPVEIVDGSPFHLTLLQNLLTPLLGPLGTAGLVLVLLIFMLLQREDLANRLIRLIGQGRISATSRVMDEAGSRVSKYLLMQLVVNVTYGIPVAIGLYFIGVPNALLWGALATVLRFIPYVGPWIAAAFPVVISMAISPHWSTPLLTIGLFVALELISNNVMEPWLYGSSTGVSPVALIVAALFWTWLWGPVGLVLATPLTVCLVVMGRHVPKLNFLSIILSDEEPLTPAEDFYHRLHRTGEHDEMDFVNHFLRANPPAALFDSVMIPVIVAAETDCQQGHLETDQLEFIQRGAREVVAEMDLQLDDPLTAEKPDLIVCCVPARAYRDETAGEMFCHLLRRNGVAANNASARMMTSELVAWVGNEDPDLVCVSTVRPSTLHNARYVCSRLRKRHPRLKIMIGLWGFPGPLNPEDLDGLRNAGADNIVTSVAEAWEQVLRYLPAQADAPPAT